MTAHQFGEGEGTHHGGSCTPTGKCYLETHGQCQFMSGKPFRDDFAYGDSAYLTAHAEDGEAETGYSRRHRQTEIESCQCESGISEITYDTIILDTHTDYHQCTCHHTCEADAHLIKDEATEEQHQEEYIDKSVTAGKKAVII